MAEQFDVVVVGSGAAALTAALAAATGGCSVVVLERASELGGTTAFSGGMMWVPGNPHFGELGGADSVEAAGRYLRGLTRGRQYDDRLIDVFLDAGPAAIEFIAKSSPLRLRASRVYTDYFADRDGGTYGGRSVIPEPFEAASRLGELADRVRVSPHFPALTLDEMVGASGADPRNTDLATMTSDDLRATLEARAASGVVANGRALVCGLLAGAVEAGVDVRLGHRVVSFGTRDGAVRSVVAEVDGRQLTVEAARGVILACGGFEWSEQLVLAHLGVTRTIPLSPPGNEGDGLRLGMSVNAGLANMSAGWSYPCALDPQRTYDGRQLGTFPSSRFEAGSIALNHEGRRFVNEGGQYNDVPKAFWKYDEVTQTYPNEPPAFLIFDQRVRDRLVVNDLRPGEPTPGWVVEAPTVAGLAEALGLDGDTVEAEVGRFNANVARGSDPDYGRGTVWFEGQSRGGPAPALALAPIQQPPFYSMEMHHGLLGTAGGLRVDGRAQVVDLIGEPILGLYACGNVAASIFGPMYPGGGTTLGLGVTFGYLAGRSAAEGTADGDVDAS